MLHWVVLWWVFSGSVLITHVSSSLPGLSPSITTCPPPSFPLNLPSRFRDFPDVWILSKLPGDVLRKLDDVISQEVKKTLLVQQEEAVKSGTCQIDPVSLEKLQSGLMFMTCLSG